MQKLRFIKGLLIGSIFSAFFWVGIYKLVSSVTANEDAQRQQLYRVERTVSKASL
ncbi:MAG: hypothetical protein AAF573_08560 [Bacteroidota bacterium]